MNIPSILNLGKQAINDAQPAGGDVRDDDDFELLQNEMAKMSNPATSSTLDWEHVMSLSSMLLADKGKDILVACYLAGGLLQTQGLPGLQAGLQIIDDMLSTYWDTLYPPVQRMRGRRNALQWLLDRIRLHGEETDWSSLAPQEPAMVDDLRARMLAIDTLIAEKDSDAPSLRPAISQINTIPVKEIAVSAETPPAAAANSAPAAASPVAVTSLDSPELIEQASAEALQRLADIAAAMADGELTPQAFRLNRLAAWSAIDQLPPVHGGQTLLPGPIPPVQDALRNLIKNQADEDLIRFTEVQLPNFPFWLDLNCVAAQALERLGSEYDAARREVCGATAWFKTRLPGIEQLAFAGGMPFADADTQQWMQSLGGSAGSAGDASGGSQPDAMRAAFGKARAQAADNDLAGAAAGLQAAIDHSASAAEKLQLRIHLCELLLEERPGASLDAFARAILTEIDKYSLGSWNPTLALQGLQAAYRVLARNDELKTESEALLAHIIALDAAAAVKLVT